MAPKFDQYLNFEAVHEIEACGPTNFAVNDLDARITRVTITQLGGGSATYVMAPGSAPRIDSAETMWEVSFDRDNLIAGPARAQGEVLVERRNGPAYSKTWSADVILVDVDGFLTFADVQASA